MQIFTSISQVRSTTNDLKHRKIHNNTTGLCDHREVEPLAAKTQEVAEMAEAAKSGVEEHATRWEALEEWRTEQENTVKEVHGGRIRSLKSDEKCCHFRKDGLKSREF